jgi:uncharacterized surface protein with fasciclin (FAS1) repeats
MSRSSPAVLTAATLLTFAVPFAATAHDSLSDGPAPEFTKVTHAKGTIVDVAAGNPNFSALVEALQSAQLVETLQGAGPFTVFAPTNRAFEKIPAPVLEALLANGDTLKKVLLYHVAAGVQDVRYQFSPKDITSVQGQQVYADRDECSKSDPPDSEVQRAACSADTPAVLWINNATVRGRVIRTDNGVIYAIDSVLLPQFR